ncbi:MAB_1171c family putative transporter [Streptomyces sp. NPDC048566]|uniref:MAB_1171c family putative transporter n=1 Tax=Streptomyces sp. NPDC048566 TaxID=3365569 RepID=UPI003720555C
MNGLINYVSAGLLWLGLAVKGPDLVRHRADPILRVMCTVMALAGLCFLLGAPPTVGWINHASGVPNLAAPLTYAAITAYSASSLVLIVHWRGGPGVCRVARFVTATYGFVLLGITTLFATGAAPTERRTDFDTYYATTPLIAEMIVLYLVAHLAAVTATALWSLRWARKVHGWLRAGLYVLGTGTVVGAGYSLSKLAAITGRWCGRSWDPLGTEVATGLAGLGALLTVVGILLPWAAPSMMTWLLPQQSYRRLAPLERVLETILTGQSLRLPRPWPSSPATLLIWRQTSIHNALTYLDPFVDQTVFDRAHDQTLTATRDRQKARAAGWAAAVAAAVQAAHDGRHPDRPEYGHPVTEAPDAAELLRIAAALPSSTPFATSRSLREAPTSDAV